MTDSNTPSNDLREADALLVNINRSIFTRALLFSTVVHIGFLALSSFSLYKDWATYGMFSDKRGFHTPSEIKSIRREQAKDAEDAERTKRMEARLAEQRAQASLADANATPTPDPAAAATAAPAAEPTVEPLPPKPGFSLDDLPGLGL